MMKDKTFDDQDQLRPIVPTYSIQYTFIDKQNSSAS